MPAPLFFCQNKCFPKYASKTATEAANKYLTNALHLLICRYGFFR